MTDIEHAKQLLTGEGYTCVICRGNDIHTSEKRGVAPLIEILDSNIDVRGYSVVMSRSAKKILDGHGIKYSCGEEVEYIINRKKDGMCPMEKAVMDIDDPAEALKKIKETIEKMRKGG